MNTEAEPKKNYSYQKMCTHFKTILVTPRGSM